ncbi:MAG: hypothetical protein AB8H79_04905 [Myxococcota bacterium]
MKRIGWLLLGLAGCQTTTTCFVGEPQTLEWDEVSPLGFAMEDVLADWSGPYDFPDAVAVGRPGESGVTLYAEKRIGNVTYRERKQVTSRQARQLRSDYSIDVSRFCFSTISAPIRTSFAFAEDEPIVMVGDMTLSDHAVPVETPPDRAIAFLDHSLPAWVDAVPEHINTDLVRTQIQITDDSVQASVTATTVDGSVSLLEVTKER